MTPLISRCGHYKLCFQRGGKNTPRFLRCTVTVKKVKISLFCGLTGPCPHVIGLYIIPEIERLYDCNFPAKIGFAVIAVPGGLLTVGNGSVPDNFMRHTPVTDKPQRVPAVHHALGRIFKSWGILVRVDICDRVRDIRFFFKVFREERSIFGPHPFNRIREEICI